MGFSLVYRGNALPLVSTAVIGRTPSCKVQLDGPGVSRRHARVVVDRDQVTIEDLGSANGVLVNDERIVGPRRLKEGDWITVGSHSLQLVVDDRPAPSHDEIEDEDTDHDFGTATQRASQLTLTGEAALEMIEVGLVNEAEQLLSGRLEKLLEEARDAGKLDDGKRREAARFALELAMATGHGRWIAYVFEIFQVTKAMMPPEVVGILGTAATHAGETVDVAAAERYLAMLQDGHAGAEQEDIEATERLVARLRTVGRQELIKTSN